MDLLENFNKLNNKLTNLLEENKKLKQQYKDQEEKLKERENFSKENQALKDKLKKREKQFQQNVLNLEKQKNEQLEMISQNLVKTLEKLESDEVNENDINIKENNKSEPTTFPLLEGDNEIVHEYNESM